MEKTKKVIILDLDETLEHGIYQSRYDVGNQMTMVLRPNLDILLKKFEMLKGKLQKDVTFFTGFGFYGGVIEWDKMLMYKNISNILLGN